MLRGVADEITNQILS